MRDIFEFAVSLPSAGHADEEAISTLNHLDVIFHLALVEYHRDEGFQLLLANGKHLDFRNLHLLSPSSIFVEPQKLVSCQRASRG